jgi:putative sporulation protein YtaF
LVSSFIEGLLLLFAAIAAVSIDGLFVGAAYSARQIKMTLPSYLCISAITGVLMSISVFLGKLAGWVLPINVKALGGAILVVIGVNQLWQSYWKQRNLAGEITTSLFQLRIRPLGLIIQILKEPARADRDNSGVVDLSESVGLGLALGVDAFTAGLGMAMSGFSLLIIPLTVLACPLFVYCGVALAKFPMVSRAIQNLPSIPGMLLALMGLVKMFR